MEVVALNVQLAHLLLRHLLTGRVLSLIKSGVNNETRARRRISDETYDDLEGAQWFATPVDRDEREHAMLDLVPLARARREVADVDRKVKFVGKALKLCFPCVRPVAVASTGVGGDEEV